MVDSEIGAVLYLDDFILAVNKPAGISVIHDSRRPQEATFYDQMKRLYGSLWVVHRLDRETSGVLIFARSEQAHRVLNEQFQARMVSKTYHLLACGFFSWQATEVDLPLRVNGDRRHRTIVDLSNGKPAITAFTILQAYEHSLFFIQAAPKSGYTHQIRAHLTSLNGAILCDRLYEAHPFPQTDALPFDATQTDAWVKLNLPIQRLALHATTIAFVHPDGGNPITVLAPFPEDFSQSLTILKQTGQV